MEDFTIDFHAENYNQFPHDQITPEERILLEKIKERKKELGDSVTILAHHYQRRWIVELGDFIGDSFQLSREASRQKSEKIIFAGVHFMAESAAILAQNNQKVYLPNHQAGCPMADMATLSEVETVWDTLTEVISDTIIPITYMNSSAEIKAFCGKHGGIVCTSSNAKAAFKWAFNRGERVLFIPDQNLGQNSALELGIPANKQVIYDPNKLFGGYSREHLSDAKVIHWKGYCHVHRFFKPEMITDLRAKHPNAIVIVHPECDPDVVAGADLSGSTKLIVEQIEKSKPGDTLIIGTEINLVYRMAQEYPDRTILPLKKSLCPNMYRISLKNIYETISSFPEEKIVTISESIKDHANIALERMLSLS